MIKEENAASLLHSDRVAHQFIENKRLICILTPHIDHAHLRDGVRSGPVDEAFYGVRVASSTLYLSTCF
jgi:hypothetical protein